MARHIGWALAISAVLGVASDARAERCDGPQAGHQERAEQRSEKPQERGVWIWWKDEAARNDLKLTTEQVAEIDKIFHTNLAKAKPLREELTALEATLNRTIRENTAEVQVVAAQVEKVESKRAELNRMRVVMLYRMRHVLTPDQNTRFQARVDRWEAARKKAGDGRSK
jgi:Spy/CpxP family protein refolding chaperone